MEFDFLDNREVIRAEDPSRHEIHLREPIKKKNEGVMSSLSINLSWNQCTRVGRGMGHFIVRFWTHRSLLKGT